MEWVCYVNSSPLLISEAEVIEDLSCGYPYCQCICIKSIHKRQIGLSVLTDTYWKLPFSYPSGGGGKKKKKEIWGL